MTKKCTLSRAAMHPLTRLFGSLKAALLAAGGTMSWDSFAKAAYGADADLYYDMKAQYGSFRAFVEQQCAHVFQLNRSQSSNASGVGHNSYEVSLRGRGVFPH